MNPYVYQRRSPKASVGARVAKPTLTGLAKQFLTALAEANISSVTALAFVLFVAVSVGVVTMVSYAEISTPETFAQNINAQKLTSGRVLGVATYGYNQPICQKNTANCLNYQLIGYSGTGWQVKVDYKLQKGFVGAVKVNSWAFMDNISGDGSGYTGNDLMPGKTYTFVLYRKYANRLYKLTDLSITAPAAPKKEPVACTQEAFQCPDGTWVGRSGASCSFVCSQTPSYGYKTVSVGPVNKGDWREGWVERAGATNYGNEPADIKISGWAFDQGKNLEVKIKLKNSETGLEYMPQSTVYSGITSDIAYYLTNKRGISTVSLNGHFEVAFTNLPAGKYYVTELKYNGYDFNVHSQANFPVYIYTKPSYGYKGTVSIQPDYTASNYSSSLPAGSVGQTLLPINFYNTGSETILISSMMFKFNPEKSWKNLTKFYLEADGVLVGSASTDEVSSIQNSLNIVFSNNLALSGNSYKQLKLKADISNSAVGQLSLSPTSVMLAPGSATPNAYEGLYQWWSKTFNFTSVSGTPTTTPTSAIRVGQLINKAGTVLLVGNGVVYGIPTLAVFNSWGWSFANVVVANPSESALPQAGVVPSRDPACATALDQIAKKCGQASTTTFKIIAPTSGEKFQTGKPYTIKWEALDKTIGNVDIELVSCAQTNGGTACSGSSQKIASNIANSGSYAWASPAPNFISNSGYQIRITQTGKTSGAVLSGTVYFYTVDNYSTLTASLNTAAGATVTVIPGAITQKVGSFKLTSGSVDGVKVSSITVSATRNIVGSNFQNLQLMSNGTRLGSVQTNFASNGEYVFSLGSPLVIPANSSVVVDVYLDVLTGASSLGLDGQNLVGLKFASGNQISNGAVITSTPAVGGQGIYYANKTGLAASLSPASPPAQTVSGGMTNKPVGVYKLVNLGNGVTISELAFSTVGVSSQPITAVYINGNKAIMAGNIAIFSNLNIQIGNLSSIDLTISADFQATGVTGGQSFTLNLTKVKYMSNSSGVVDILNTNIASNKMSFLSSFIDTYNSPPGTPVMSLGPSGNIPTATAQQFNFLATDADKDTLTYDVFWGDNTTSSTATGISGTPIGVMHTWSVSGAYQIRVYVRDDKGGSSSNSFNVTVAGPVVISPKPVDTICQAPINLSPSTVLNSNTQSVTLSWGAVSGATGYNIRLDDGTSDRYSDTRFSNCSNSPHYYCVNGITGTSIVNVPVKPGRSYKFWVDPAYTTARNYCNGTSNFSVAGITAPPVVTAPAPTATPTASLVGSVGSAVASGYVMAKAGDTINYTWASTNADSASSQYYMVDKNGLTTGPFAWVASTINGNTSAKVDASQTGKTYMITFKATNSKTGQTVNSNALYVFVN